MKVLLVLAHPSTKSFNYAIAQTAAETVRELGHELIFHDLYREGFDPVMPEEELSEPPTSGPIAQQIEELCQADAIIVVHPNWWSQAPAILRGWVDRVVRDGKAYRFVPDGKGGAYPEGLLKAKVALIFNTANTPQEVEESLYGDPLEVHWKKVVFGLCGVKNVRRCVFSPIITSTPEQRAAWLQEVRKIVREELSKG